MILWLIFPIKLLSLIDLCLRASHGPSHLPRRHDPQEIHGLPDPTKLENHDLLHRFPIEISACSSTTSVDAGISARLPFTHPHAMIVCNSDTSPNPLTAHTHKSYKPPQDHLSTCFSTRTAFDTERSPREPFLLTTLNVDIPRTRSIAALGEISMRAKARTTMQEAFWTRQGRQGRLG